MSFRAQAAAALILGDDAATIVARPERT